MFDQLSRQLDRVMGRDRPGFKRRLRGLERRAAQGLPYQQGLERLGVAIGESVAARERRTAAGLEIAFDEALPIARHARAIEAAIQAHRVVVVAGETGSGKTTQLPKMCLNSGRGRDGWIGVTQPRRIAARSIAARLSEELNCRLGAEVGYQVRFDDRTSADSLIKVMTDGILLAATQRDRTLDAYDTLIIDEAHERSLNIDFLIGYLKRLLPRRPDLKLIITSATIDTARFAAHFDEAPVIEVSGRGYPVEFRYRPLAAAEPGEPDRDLMDGICAAVEELDQVDPRGDVLVFLPGERDIRDAAEALGRMRMRDTEILPLYARLARHRQQQIFHPGPARRIVLATNVAETSLTVPRIRFVIDSGLARISRYSHRSKVQRLPIEAISQASAAQRAGRCGRLGPGICIRLYDETDFSTRPEYTEPEILRTNLATVILMMKSLALGEIEDFPFLEPPAARYIADGYQLLFELGALDRCKALTRIGRELAQWPLDVRLARLLAAGRDAGCLDEALVIASFLTLNDPRERPYEATAAADEAHAQWNDPRSDFAAVLNLWRAWVKVRQAGSNKTRRDWCRERFLSAIRMREWADVHTQLRDQARESRWPLKGASADYETLHRSLVVAFLSHIGLKDERDYLGARGQRFSIFPGSGLFAKPPRWVVGALLVETARVYARVNARIEPEWVEAAAPHLVKPSSFDPHWSRRAGRVIGYERVTLYGLPLVVKRRIHYGEREPEEARGIFIREALIGGELNSKGGFLAHNRKLIAEVRDLEARQRRRDLLAGEPELYRFFDERLPADICTAKAFERWRRAAESKSPRFLYLSRELVLARADHAIDGAAFPDALEIDGTAYRVVYELAPGEPSDGVNLQVPLHLLNTLQPEPLEWLVPGLLHEKVTALIKSLPKARRRNFVPAPDYARKFVSERSRAGSLSAALADFLHRDTGVAVAADDFQPAQLEAHLRINIQVRDGRTLVAQGRDLSALKRDFGEDAREEFLAQSDREYFLDGLDSWSFGALPERVELDGGAPAYPALVDQEDSVGVRLFEEPGEAAEYHVHGLRRLLQLTLKDKFRYLARSLPLEAKLSLEYAPIDSPRALKEDLVFASSMASLSAFGEPVRDPDAFERLAAHARVDLLPRATRLTEILRQVLAEFTRVRRALAGDFESLYPLAHADVESQLGHLLYPGFLTEVALERLEHYPRYLRAISVRLERLALDPARDRQRQDRIDGFWSDYLERCAAVEEYPRELDEFHWLCEEYRVSLFAQELKTAVPVSAKRLRTLWAKLT